MPPRKRMSRKFFIGAAACLLFFAGLAKSAHDPWAATLIYVSLLLLFVLMIVLTPRFFPPPLRWPLLFPALLVLIVLSVSFFRSANPYESFFEIMDWAACLVFFFICVNAFQKEEDVKFLCGVFVVFFVIEAGVMFREWLIIYSLVSDLIIPYKEPVGTFISANSAVAFSLLWFPYFIRQAFSSASAPSRWYWTAGAVSISIILLLVLSTWSVFCLAAGALAYGGLAPLRRYYQKNRVLFWIALIVLSAVLLSLVWYKLALVYEWAGLKTLRIAPTSRLEWWVAGLRMWKDHPWFGVGIGNFPSAYLTYKMGAGQNTLYAHGFFIQILAEAGLAGAAAIFLFIGSCLFVARSEIFRPAQPLATGLLMFFLYSAIHVSFEYLSHLLALGLFLGILVSRTEEGLKGTPRLSMKILLGGVALGAIPTVVSPFFASRLWVEGKAAFADKKWDEAEKSFKSALELDRRCWEPYWGLARVAKGRGDLQEARQWGEEALRRNKLDLRLKKAVENL